MMPLTEGSYVILRDRNPHAGFRPFASRLNNDALSPSDIENRPPVAADPLLFAAGNRLDAIVGKQCCFPELPDHVQFALRIEFGSYDNQIDVAVPIRLASGERAKENSFSSRESQRSAERQDIVSRRR